MKFVLRKRLYLSSDSQKIVLDFCSPFLRNVTVLLISEKRACLQNGFKIQHYGCLIERLKRELKVFCGHQQNTVIRDAFSGRLGWNSDLVLLLMKQDDVIKPHISFCVTSWFTYMVGTV